MQWNARNVVTETQEVRLRGGSKKGMILTNPTVMDADQTMPYISFADINEAFAKTEETDEDGRLVFEYVPGMKGPLHND